jgi:hypothetical protein
MPNIEWYYWIVVVIGIIFLIRYLRWVVTAFAVISSYKYWQNGGDPKNLVGFFIAWGAAMAFISNWEGGFLSSKRAGNSDRERQNREHQRREFDKRF